MWNPALPLSILLAATLGLSACGGQRSASARGARIYAGNCTACHNADPSLEGTMGPAVMGSSRELLEARVVRAEYPPGYTAKSQTRLMVPLPYLAGEVDALAAYLSDGS